MKKYLLILSFFTFFSCADSADARCVKNATNIYKNKEWILKIVDLADPLSCQWKRSATGKSLDERIEEGETGFEILPLISAEYSAKILAKKNQKLRYILVKDMNKKKEFIIDRPIYSNDIVLKGRNAQKRISPCLKYSDKNLVVIDYGDTAVAYFERSGWKSLQCGD